MTGSLQFLHRDATVLDSQGGHCHVVQIAFLGKGVPEWGPENRGDAIRSLLPDGVEPAWADQIHSTDVAYTETMGSCGPADALVTQRTGLALTVVTADCVPILLAAPGPHGPHIAAVHAGWRGVAGDIVAEAVSRFKTPPATAWIGPAISGDVYEVGPDVASKVATASGSRVVALGPSGREHVDLRRAVEIQLRRNGVLDIRQIEHCTFSDPSLWSYRRDGKRAGRNLSAIWMTLKN